MNLSLQNIKNTIDFYLRKKIKFSRRGYFLPPQNKPLSDDYENELIEKYSLQNFRADSSVRNYFENLYITDLLHKYLDVEFAPELRVLDIGCKDWFYAKGEYYFFKKYCEKLEINGIELDANRIYSNFYSRKEAAKYNIKGLDGAQFIEGDFLAHNQKYDYIIWILPFLFESPLLKWGLPLKFFKPREMLEHALLSLKNGGKLFIINQGEDEYEQQKKLCDAAGIAYASPGKAESRFFKYKHDRYIMIINKNA